MGAPEDLPLKTPLIISGISASFRGVVPLAPGFLRSISMVKSSGEILPGAGATYPAVSIFERVDLVETDWQAKKIKEKKRKGD